jgi:hypothetical protein
MLEFRGPDSAGLPAPRCGLGDAQGLRLIDNASNDGDSFRVRASNGDELLFRLYHVDCPEGAKATKILCGGVGRREN